MNNYISFHNHSMMSNPCTIMDSVTSYKQYVDKTKELNMKTIVFTEHGNFFSWVSKKRYLNENGMKYIHAIEAYVTESLTDKVRDNYHCILIATNYDSIKELNLLFSKSWSKEDGHFYHNPRISYDELKSLSNNIIILTGCLGSILGKGNDNLKNDFINFLSNNKDRCFLEIQHHNVKEQIEYNKYLYEIHKKYNIPLVATGDFHSLNKELAEARLILQKSKNTHFDNEDDWDTIFKSYDEFVEAFKIQNSIPENDYMIAIKNTNLVYNMVEDFEFDMSLKYPKVYDNSKKVFQDKIKENLIKKPYLQEKYPNLKERVYEEYEVFKKLNQIDFMLLQNHIREWEKLNNIYVGYSRGSISGSMIAYILGITEIDSIKMNLNFFRFTNLFRINSVADIDSDYYSQDRDRVKEFLLKDKLNLKNINTCNIITFNTIAIKGAVRDVGRALEIPLSEIDYISKNIEDKEESFRKEYPELFKYVDLLNGTITSLSIHAGGVVITDRNYKELVGTFISKDSEYDVSVIDMNDIDYLKYIKMDILGLDNVGLINKTCELVNIERLTPDNTNEFDEKVWNSIAEDATLIFQWTSKFASEYLKNMLNKDLIEKVKSKIDNFSYIKWVSFGNGLLRPGCASFRDDVLNGEFYDNGFEELNNLLSPTLGRLAMQEDLMVFLNKFCGYTMSEADVVRKNISKKGNTNKLVDEIRERFIKFSTEKYNISEEQAKKTIDPFITIILDSVSYLFSWNHSDAYTWIGYVAGYLRYYYPLEFLTTALNIFENNEDKTSSIIKYIKNKTNIKIESIKFGFSKAEYFYDKKTNSIYKGLKSIKDLNEISSNELYNLSQQKQYTDFFDLLLDIKSQTSLKKNQLEILIKLDYFSDFGKSKKHLTIVEIYDKIYGKKTVSKSKISEFFTTEDIIQKFTTKETAKQYSGLDDIGLIKYLIQDIEDKDISLKDRLQTEQEYLGYLKYTNENLSDKFNYVTEIKTYSNINKPYIKTYCLHNGEIGNYRIEGGFIENEFKEGDIIKINETYKKQKMKKDEDGKWVKTDGYNEFIKRWEVI